MQSPLCIVALISCGIVVAARPCLDGGCPVPNVATGLIQRRAAQALASMGISQAEVNPKGTLDLLLNEMTAYVDSKGQTGLDPDEIEHIHGIKALIDNTILPTILEEVEDDRRELEQLYAEIEACHDHAHEVSNITRTKEDSVDMSFETFKECAKKEDEVIIEKETVCEEFNRTRLIIHMPNNEDFPPPNVPDEEMIKYLDMMNEWYCGTYEVFEEEWKECENLTHTYTILHEQCQKFQKDYQIQTCSWKTTLETSCETYDTCWTDAVRAYNLRKKEMLELQLSRIGEYEGATKIECLWSAWEYEGQPCTVNKTRIKECHEFKPNYTNVTIQFPPPPPPPPCDASSVDIDVCSDQWMQMTYGPIKLTAAHMEEIRSLCEPCPTVVVTEAPVMVHAVNLVNMESAGGDSYMKVKGMQQCDAFIESDGSNVYSVKVKAAEWGGKVVAELATDAATYSVELMSRVATTSTGDIEMYEDGADLSLVLSAGSVVLMHNGVAASTLDTDVAATSGRAKVSICSGKGTIVDAHFDTVDEQGHVVSLADILQASERLAVADLVMTASGLAAEVERRMKRKAEFPPSRSGSW
eukprot:CAMPEP_0178399060 /NCGR_PEP_ID=MMETSP0689_2-20121128/15087_1 /TAXON_ID=160604 /ORGANISM="Amphidinium massartii, Strain CS-259" /LENGTH=582 /DNA_ID=CAMNT_0020019829 /DNA_START=67 /DNA_END=1813 /DNA_ORIENTATION=+